MILEELPDPKVKKNYCIVQVRAASVNPVDYKIRSGSLGPLPFKKPHVVGFDFAGVVLEVGLGVSQFKVGDRVYGVTPVFSGGSYAQKSAVHKSQMDRIPDTMSFEQAAALPVAGLTAYKSLISKARLKSGQRLLVIGASGGVGHLAIQIGKAVGAHITAVCGKTNFEKVRGMGADVVVDYPEGLEKLLNQAEDFDVVYDSVAKYPFKKFTKVLKKGGVFLTTLPQWDVLARFPINLISRNRAYYVGMDRSNRDLSALNRFFEQGQLKPWIGIQLPLEQARKAHEIIESGHSQGKIVLQISQGL